MMGGQRLRWLEGAVTHSLFKPHTTHRPAASIPTCTVTEILAHLSPGVVCVRQAATGESRDVGRSRCALTQFMHGTTLNKDCQETMRERITTDGNNEYDGLSTLHLHVLKSTDEAGHCIYGVERLNRCIPETRKKH